MGHVVAPHDDGRVDCDVAREALSARLDGEREPVPSARVDEHLVSCGQCQAWYADTRAWATRLRQMTGPSEPNLAAVVRPQRPARARRWRGWVRLHGVRLALAAVGLMHIAVATVQAAGIGLGAAAAHSGTMTVVHLLSVPSAGFFALGAAMLVAAGWPPAAGWTCVVFAVVLTGYVVSDGLAGQLAGVRLASHLFAALGMVLVFVVWRGERAERISRNTRVDGGPGDIDLPGNATRGRRRGHLRPVDDPAA